MTQSPNTIGYRTRHMALIGLMTAVICILAPFSLVLPFSPIPVSLGTLAISFVVTVLGMRGGLISTALYIVLGLVGLPVFSGFTGGAGRLFGPTGGYIIGYLFMAAIYGFFAEKWGKMGFLRLLGLLLGTIVCYLFGTLWLSYQSALTPAAAFTAAVLPFLPTELIKLPAAFLLGTRLRQRLTVAGLL